MKLNYKSAQLMEKGQMEVWDDFHYYTDGNEWTKSAGSGGGVAIAANTAGGVLALTTGGTQNIQALIASTNAIFKFLAGRQFYAEALIQYTEANTNQNALAFGLSSVVTNVMLQDTTGIPATSFSGALIYKQTGDTVWRCITSNSTTQTLNQSVKSTQPSPTTTYQCLRIEGRDVDGTNIEVTFFVDDQPLIDNSTHRPIKQTVALTSASAMKLVVFEKNVGGANSETLNVDYAYGLQRRS